MMSVKVPEICYRASINGHFFLSLFANRFRDLPVDRFTPAFRIETDSAIVFRKQIVGGGNSSRFLGLVASFSLGVEYIVIREKGPVSTPTSLITLLKELTLTEHFPGPSARLCP